LEEWLYSDAGDKADLGTLTQRLDDERSFMRTQFPQYYEEHDKAKAAMEAQLKAEAEAAAKERAENGEEEDHDRRKLKYPDRLRMVESNKKEGTELFKDGNYRTAAARYNKALTHAAKFFDLSPDQRTNVDKIKLSLELNMAQCYLKMENLDKVVMHASHALQIDEKSTKAYYRRALAMEKKKDYEKAKADLEAALKEAPEDKAVLKLMERVKAQIKRQTAKEKKMWGKAFS